MEESFTQLDQQLRATYLQRGKKIGYGTAGFRDLAENIEYISFRVGVFVALLNKTAPSKTLGVVVSASHNKIQDNGLKITNFNGNMLEMEYEPVLEQFVNTESLQEAINIFKQYLKGKKLNVFNVPVTVCVGGDTRPSTRELIDLVTKGVQSVKGDVLDFDETTTPQLQYYVYWINNVVKPKSVDKELQVEELRPVFWENFIKYFLICEDFLGSKLHRKRTVDCANGVGGVVFPTFAKSLGKYIDFELTHNDDKNKLNEGCGADYVKTTKKFPFNFKSREHNSFISFDGDADRIVLYTETDGKLNLIDGDRIGTLLTMFFKTLLDRLAKETEIINQNEQMFIQLPLSEVTIGFVQTYYANSASSEYLNVKFGMEPVFAATGVKHLHEKAEHFDIGVYFEGNGHGTVIFKPDLPQKIEALLINKDSLLQAMASDIDYCDKLSTYMKFLEFFSNCVKLANPSVGDAITDLLLIEIALEYLGLDYAGLLNLYTDYESRTSKIKVKTKSVLKVNDIEDKVLYPENIQPAIEAILLKHNGIKAFVRASGTEDVLRLHVEAKDMATIEKIEKEIGELIATDKNLN